MLKQSDDVKVLVFTGVMDNDGAMLRTILFLLVLTTSAIARDSVDTAGTASSDAQIWNLEKAYWDDVKASDLERYRALWHEDFVGWPFVDSAPVHKDHITDWITNNTSKGLRLQSYAIEQLAVHVTGDVAIDHYRIKMTWANNEGTDNRTDIMRITHTWIRSDGTWQIIGGMSAPVDANGK